MIFVDVQTLKTPNISGTKNVFESIDVAKKIFDASDIRRFSKHSNIEEYRLVPKTESFINFRLNMFGLHVYRDF